MTSIGESSNLQIVIHKALKISSNLSELWTSGDLPQKKKIQWLVFPFEIGYDKLKGKVQTKRINPIFSSIHLLSIALVSEILLDGNLAMTANYLKSFSSEEYQNLSDDMVL